MKMLVGLGNYGKKYEATRHNIGFMVADLFADELGLDFKEAKKHRALIAEGNLEVDKILVVKPLTYMNASGEAVRSIVDYYKIDIKDILVVYDDMDMDIGRMRFRSKGSAGGQRGMKNIIDHLGTTDIQRLKIGIGRPVQKEAVDYVLSVFSRTEWEQVKETLLKAVEAVKYAFKEGIVEGMNRYNG